MAAEQLWLPCTKKERADMQFKCPRCGRRDFRVFVVRYTGDHVIACVPCGHRSWLREWDDLTVLR